MNPQPRRKDLVVLVADRNMEFAVRGILTRHRSFGARAIEADFYTHPGHDPGCYNYAAAFLAPLRSMFSKALVVLDREGCGHESEGRDAIERKVGAELTPQWGTDATAVVIDPELEAWVWSDSPHVDRILGWEGANPPLRRWLEDKSLLNPGAEKPADPKRAVEQALREVRQPRSSAIYRKLAENVGLQRCQDPAFSGLKETLVAWFPAV